MSAADERLTADERKAVKALERVAQQWPRSITLASMGGTLVVVHTGDPQFDGWSSEERSRAVLATIDGIPNTGGDW